MTSSAASGAVCAPCAERGAVPTGSVCAFHRLSRITLPSWLAATGAAGQAAMRQGGEYELAAIEELIDARIREIGPDLWRQVYDRRAAAWTPSEWVQDGRRGVFRRMVGIVRALITLSALDASLVYPFARTEAAS